MSERTNTNSKTEISLEIGRTNAVDTEKARAAQAIDAGPLFQGERERRVGIISGGWAVSSSRRLYVPGEALPTLTMHAR